MPEIARFYGIVIKMFFDDKQIQTISEEHYLGIAYGRISLWVRNANGVSKACHPMICRMLPNTGRSKAFMRDTRLNSPMSWI